MDDSKDDEGLKDEQAVSAKESNGVKDDHYCRPIEVKLMRFNPRRYSRGAPAAEVWVDGIALWMFASDLHRNIREFGSHPEFTKALEHYKTKQEYPPKEQA